MAGKGSYFSRFFVKLMEIMVAAIATAVSGYLVAHLSGYLPPQLSGFLPSQIRGPVPAVVETAPNQSIAPKSIPVQPVPAAADAGEQRAAPQQDSSPPAGKKSAKVVPARKTAKSDANAIENKPRDGADKARDGADTKPREAADAKSREGADSKAREAADKETVEAQVRAALANVDANRPASQRPAEPPASAATITPPPRVVDPGPQPAPQPAPQASLQPPSGQTAPPIPPAAVPAPVQAAPVQPAPAQPDSLTSVEIKSRPVATVDETAPLPEQPAAPHEERGLLSAIKHMLPDLRRPTPTGEVPRPPAPVGDDSR